MTPAAFARLTALEVGFFIRRPLNGVILLLVALAMIAAAASGKTQADKAGSEVARATTESADARLSARAAARMVPAAPAPIEQYRDPTDPYGYLFYFAHVTASRPPGALALLATGEADLRPSALRIGPGHLFLDGAGAVANPRLARIGSFDPAFVLVYILPLALIALTGTFMAAERDSGAWRFIAAQPVSMGSVAAAKFIAATSIAVPVIGGAFWASLAVNGAVTPDTVASLLRIGLALLAYCLFWIALAAIVTRRGGVVASLTSLIGIWVGLLFLVPQELDQISRAVAPPPSPLAAIEAVRRAKARFDADPIGCTTAWLASQGLHRHDLATRMDMQRLAENAMRRRALVPFEQATRRHDQRISSWRRAAAFVSPGMALGEMLTVAAGTDADGFATFRRAADDAARRIERRFQPLIVMRALGDQPVRDATIVQHYEAMTAPSSVPATPGRAGLEPLAIWSISALLSAVLSWRQSHRTGNGMARRQGSSATGTAAFTGGDSRSRT